MPAMLAILLIFTTSTISSAQHASFRSETVCPPERPIQRVVETHQLCTLQQCIGALHCPRDDSQPCRYTNAGDRCEICTPQYAAVCLTLAELEASRK